MNKKEILSILKQSIYDLSALVENISNSPSLEIAGSLVSRNQHGKKRLFKRLTGSEDQYARLDLDFAVRYLVFTGLKS